MENSWIVAIQRYKLKVRYKYFDSILNDCLSGFKLLSKFVMFPHTAGVHYDSQLELRWIYNRFEVSIFVSGAWRITGCRACRLLSKIRRRCYISRIAGRGEHKIKAVFSDVQTSKGSLIFMNQWRQQFSTTELLAKVSSHCLFSEKKLRKTSFPTKSRAPEKLVRFSLLSLYWVIRHCSLSALFHTNLKW